MRLHTRFALHAAALATLVAAPVSAQPSVTIDFEHLTPNAQGFLSAFPARNGFVFENFGAYASTTRFGTGANASSGTNFAYGYANTQDDASFVYRLDNQNFSFLSAALSFRTFDADVSPAELVVNGYRTGLQPVFTRILSLTNTAQRFDFNWTDVNEVEFVTTALDDQRSAVLAVDDFTATVPEPGSIVLLATGLGAIALVGARRRTKV